ncbi:MAG: hypothetical protein IBX50_11990 [Marinospirillum sp.]|uniref:LPD1 domain-containing protein n=1 Tax=Marinospirillum sp. TaxID=2183934 RepID=UPI0019E34F8D|nr:LPD1 domain-containing protein [Marinospirillum sp.]MBE0507417.1 hypothetical protein [Marinospirillum sp.]
MSKKNAERLNDYGVFLPGAPKDRAKALSELLVRPTSEDKSTSEQSGTRSASPRDHILPGFEGMPHAGFMTGLFNNILDSVNLDAESVMDSLQACSQLSRKKPTLGAEMDNPYLSPDKRMFYPHLAAAHTLGWLADLERGKHRRDLPFAEPALDILRHDIMAYESASQIDVARFHQSTLSGWAKSIKKDLLWPKPDFQALSEQGLPASVLLSMKNLRDNLPATAPAATPAAILAYANTVLSCRYAFESFLESVPHELARMNLDAEPAGDLSGQAQALLRELIFSDHRAKSLVSSAFTPFRWAPAREYSEYRSVTEGSKLLEEMKTQGASRDIHVDAVTLDASDNQGRLVDRDGVCLIDVSADAAHYESRHHHFEPAYVAADQFYNAMQNLTDGLSMSIPESKRFDRAKKILWPIRVKLSSACNRGSTNDMSFRFTRREREAWENFWTIERPSIGEKDAPLVLPVVNLAVLGIKDPESPAAEQSANNEQGSQESPALPDTPDKKKPQVYRVEREAPVIKQAIDWDGRDPLSSEQLEREDFASLAAAIGARGFQVGNWLGNQETRDVCRLTFNAMEDMAEALKWPMTRLGLGVQPDAMPTEQDAPLVEAAYKPGDALGLAFGARGKGKAAAHYEPSLNVINLTRLSGAGSMAHEMGHALDHRLLQIFDVSRSNISNAKFRFLTGNKDGRIHFVSEIIFMEAIIEAQKGLSGQAAMASMLSSKLEWLLRPEFRETGKPVAHALAQWMTALFVSPSTEQDLNQQLVHEARTALLPLLLENHSFNHACPFLPGFSEALKNKDQGALIQILEGRVKDRVTSTGLRNEGGFIGREAELAHEIAIELAEMMGYLHPDLLAKIGGDKDDLAYALYELIENFRSALGLPEEMKALSQRVLKDADDSGIQAMHATAVRVLELSDELSRHIYEPSCPLVRAELIKNPPSISAAEFEHAGVNAFNPFRSDRESVIRNLQKDFTQVRLPSPHSESMGFNGRMPHVRTLTYVAAVQDSIAQWAVQVGAQHGLTRSESDCPYRFAADVMYMLAKKGGEGLEVYPDLFHGQPSLIQMPAMQQLLERIGVTQDQLAEGLKTYREDGKYAVSAKIVKLIEQQIDRIRLSLLPSRLANALKLQAMDEKPLSLHVSESIDNRLERNPHAFDGEDLSIVSDWAQTIYDHALKSGAVMSSEPEARAVFGDAVIDRIKPNEPIHNCLLAARDAASSKYAIHKQVEKDQSHLELHEELRQKKQAQILPILQKIADVYPRFRYMDEQERAEAMNDLLPEWLQIAIKQKGFEGFFCFAEPGTTQRHVLNEMSNIELIDAEDGDLRVEQHSELHLLVEWLKEIRELSSIEYLRDHSSSSDNQLEHDLATLSALLNGQRPSMNYARQIKPSGLLERSFARAGISLDGQNYTFNSRKKSANTYWSHPTELFARTFETAVHDSLEKQGQRSRFLVSGTKSDMYPEGAEREKFNQIMLNLAELAGPQLDRLNELTLKERQQESKRTLENGRGEPSAA